MPSLLLDGSALVPPGSPHTTLSGQADALMAMALQGREEEARDELRQLFDGGLAPGDMELGLLAPAAEKLGVLWENDSLSFVDVTIATGTLQRLMHFVSVDLAGAPLLGAKARAILVFPEPGAEHIFGAGMAANFFRRAGWQVHYVPDSDIQKLRRIVETNDIDVLGLSLGREEAMPAAARLVGDLRARSRNRKVLAIGGGAALMRAPLMIDGTPLDAAVTAVARAPGLIGRMVAQRGRES